MGITPITDAMGLSEQIIPSAASSRVNTDQGSDFRSIWNDQAKGISAGTNPPENTGADRKPETGDIAYKRSDGTKTDVRSRESSETASERNEKISDKGKMLTDEEIVSAQETLSAAAMELENRLADILNISPGELEDMLEASGLDAMGLLDRDTLSAFLMSVLGEESGVTLLTNEENYGIFRDGMEALSDILSAESEDGSLSMSELKALLEESAGNGKASDESVTRFVRNSEGELEKVSENAEGTRSGESVVLSSAQESAKQKGSDNGEHGTENAFDANSFAPGTFNGTREIAAEAPQTFYTPDPREIADQILDQMKVFTDGDLSDVEMQLHPASLGTLQIHVTNNSGVITASFVTENEAVRAAVESQMVRLNEQLEAQGIRVDAVEVTVASHSFEGNLDSGSGAGEERNPGSSRRSRRIDLEGIDELDTSDMEEDERIAAEMMAANGNKVDYMA